MGERVRGGSRRVVPRSTSFRTISRLMLIPVAGLLLILVWSFVATHLPLPAAPEKRVAPVKAGMLKPKAHAAAAGANRGGEIVLILDDVGFDRQPLAAAMAIDPNVNFAVLPNARNATTVATTLHARGFEVLCHLPMEPEGFPKISPGENAVLTTMTSPEIAATTRAGVAAVPFARGMNNHMGSRATADKRVMETVLGALPKGMYFIDSRTTAGSVAAATARSMSIRTASRSVFLDDVQDDAAIRAQLRILADDAATKGTAVGIGHMYASTIRVLAAGVPQLRERGLRFVRASEIVR